MSFKERYLEENTNSVPFIRGLAGATAVGGLGYGFHNQANDIRRMEYNQSNKDYIQQQENIKNGLTPVNPIAEVPLSNEGDTRTLINFAKQSVNDLTAD